MSAKPERNADGTLYKPVAKPARPASAPPRPPARPQQGPGVLQDGFPASRPVPRGHETAPRPLTDADVVSVSNIPGFRPGAIERLAGHGVHALIRDGLLVIERNQVERATGVLAGFNG